MFYAAYTTPDGERIAAVFEDYNRPIFYEDTFSPETIIHGVVDFHTHGKTYADKKQSVIDAAIKFNNIDSDVSGGLSWGEMADITNWFEIMARRYGLITEFRENGII